MSEDVMDTPTKVCRDCGIAFPYSELVQNSHCPGGVDAFCRSCRRIKRRHPKATTPGFKVCRDCGQTYPYSALKKSNNCTDGVRALCKACANLREQHTYAGDLDNSRQYNREKSKRLHEENPDKSREKIKKWRLDNPDVYRKSKQKSDKRYYERNGDQIRAGVR